MVCPTGGFGGTFGGPTVAVAGTAGTIAGVVGTTDVAGGIGVGTITGVSCACGVAAGVGIVVWFVVIFLVSFNCFFAPQRLAVLRAYLSPRRKVRGVNGASFNLFTFMIEGWLPYWKALLFIGLRCGHLNFALSQDRRFRLFRLLFSDWNPGWSTVDQPFLLIEGLSLERNLPLNARGSRFFALKEGFPEFHDVIREQLGAILAPPYGPAQNVPGRGADHRDSLGFKRSGFRYCPAMPDRVVHFHNKAGVCNGVPLSREASDSHPLARFEQ